MTVLEGADTIGGGTRSAELTVPGLLHDVCSAVHPFGGRLAVPALAARWREHGLVWRYPEVDLVHPLDDGTAGVMVRSLDETCAGLGVGRAAPGGSVFGPLVTRLRRPRRRRAAARCSAGRATRSGWRGSGCGAGLPATVLVTRFRTPQAQGPVRRLGGPHLPAARPARHRVGRA